MELVQVIAVHHFSFREIFSKFIDVIKNLLFIGTLEFLWSLLQKPLYDERSKKK